MKKILTYAGLSLVMLSATSCFTEKQVFNRQVETEKYGSMLLGRQTKSQLSREPFSEWYDEEYKEYEYDTEIIKELKKNKLKSYEVVVFFGTWCGDTHRELPRLMKILDAVEYPEQKLKLIAVNRRIETPNGEDVPHNIRRVPTIIVRKYGRELGRIIENTQSGSLEQDLLNIIKRK